MTDTTMPVYDFALRSDSWRNIFECLHSEGTRIAATGNFWASVQALESQFDEAAGQVNTWVGRRTPHSIVNDLLVAAVARLELIIDGVDNGRIETCEDVGEELDTHILGDLKRAVGTMSPGGMHGEHDAFKDRQ